MTQVMAVIVMLGALAIGLGAGIYVFTLIYRRRKKGRAGAITAALIASVAGGAAAYVVTLLNMTIGKIVTGL